jgi:hypoxanthine phosphoribosyltransferase
MKWIKLFEDFKENNQEGTLITKDDIITCITHGGVIYADIIHDFPNNDEKEPLSPVDIDSDGDITVQIDQKLYIVNLKDVKRIEY